MHLSFTCWLPAMALLPPHLPPAFSAGSPAHCCCLPLFLSPLTFLLFLFLYSPSHTLSQDGVVGSGGGECDRVMGSVCSPGQYVWSVPTTCLLCNFWWSVLSGAVCSWHLFLPSPPVHTATHHHTLHTLLPTAHLYTFYFTTCTLPLPLLAALLPSPAHHHAHYHLHACTPSFTPLFLPPCIARARACAAATAHALHCLYARTHFALLLCAAPLHCTHEHCAALRCACLFAPAAHACPHGCWPAPRTALLHAAFAARTRHCARAHCAAAAHHAPHAAYLAGGAFARCLPAARCCLRGIYAHRTAGAATTATCLLRCLPCSVGLVFFGDRCSLLYDDDSR